MKLKLIEIVGMMNQERKIIVVHVVCNNYVFQLIYSCYHLRKVFNLSSQNFLYFTLDPGRHRQVMKLARRLQMEEDTNDIDITNETSIEAENVTKNYTNFTESKLDTINITDTLKISENYEQQGDDVESKEISKRSVGEHIGLYFS